MADYEAYFSGSAAAPPPGEQPPVAPQQPVSYEQYFAEPAPEQQAAPQEQAPAEQPVDNTYHPGTNAPLDAAFAVGNKIGDVVQAVGGESARKNLEGLAPPIQEVAEANSIPDKLNAASNYWDRPFNTGVERAVKQATDAQPDAAPYNLTNPDDLGRMAGDFGAQLQDYAAHPEDALYAMGGDVAEGSAVFGEQGFNDWVTAHPDAASQYANDPQGLYQAWKSDIGYSPDTGGLLGLGKGIVQDSLMDPSLIPSVALGGGATKAEKVLTEAGRVGTARGVMKGADLLQTAIGGPDDLLLEKGPGILAKTVGKAIPQPVKGLFQASDETARRQQTEATQEVARGTSQTRYDAGLPPPTNPIVGTSGPAATTATAAPVPQTAPPNLVNTNPSPIPNRPTQARPRPSQSSWVFNQGQIERDGRLPTRQDLADGREELLATPPHTLEGFDQSDLTGGPLDTPGKNLSVIRAALTRGEGTSPYMLDDRPMERIAQNSRSATPDRARNEAGARFIDYNTKRINAFGQPEIEHQLAKLNRTKYRGRPNEQQDVAIWYDNMRKSVRDSIKRSTYDGPVNLGHASRKVNGVWQQTGPEIIANPQGTGTPLNIADFEPGPEMWQALQTGAHPGSRIATPPTRPNSVGPSPVSVSPAPRMSRPRMAAAPQRAAALRTIPTQGQAFKFDGLPVPEGYDTTLEMRVGDKTVYDTLVDRQDDIHAMLDYMQGTSDPLNHLPALSTKYGKVWKDLYGFDPDFANLSREDANLFAADATTRDWTNTLTPLVKKTSTGLTGGVLKATRDIADFRSAVGLYNYGAFGRQILAQHLGNTMTGLITKPSTLTRMLDLRTSVPIYKELKRLRTENAQGARAMTAQTRSFRKLGLPTNNMISNPGHSLAGDIREPMNPALRQIKKWVAPDILRDMVSIPDMMWRDAVTSTHFQPAMRALQKDFGKEASQLATDAVRRNAGLQISPQRVEKVVSETFKAHYSPEMRYSETTAKHLQDALTQAFPNVPNPGEFAKFSNQLGRSYATKLNTVYQSTAKESMRLTFSWDSTNLDEALRHVFLYHYWSTRAGGLYGKELLKNPWMMANFVRLSQGLAEEAQQNDYPDWMQNFARLASSPAGSILFMNPTNLVGTIFSFADWQYGMEPDKMGSDLTLLGRARGILPAMLNPVFDSLAWGLGLFGGEDARPTSNPLGFEQVLTIPAQLLNLANLNGDLPAGMFRDEFGDPILLPERPMTDLIAKFSSAIGSVVRPDAQPIPDLFASYNTATQAYLVQNLIEDHPDWTEDQVTRQVYALELQHEQGKDPDEWLAAERMALGASLQGPELEQVPEPIRGLVGGAIRKLSPLQILSRPEVVMANRATPVGVPGKPVMDLPAMQDQYDSFDLSGGIYDTTRMTGLKIADENWYGDPALSDASKKKWSIINADNVDGVDVDGTHYTQDDLKSLTDSQRYKLASASLKEAGFTEADLEAQQQTQGMLEESNPDLAGYKGFVDALGTGEERKVAVDNLYATEPAFKRMMDQSPYPKGSDDWYNKTADWKETYLGGSGVKTSNYDPTTIPAGMDTSGYQADRAATRDASAANRADSYTGKTERSINEYMLAQDLLDQEYPGYGYTVGSGSLPSDVWTHMKQVWGDSEIDTAYITKTNHYGAQYVNWVLSNPDASDTSVQAYLDATITDDGSNKFADEAATSVDEVAPPVDLNGPVNTAWLQNRYGLQPKQGSSLQLVKSAQDVTLRSSANGSPISLLPKNTPLRVVAIEGDWVHVTAPGGWEGYVPVTVLQVA